MEADPSNPGWCRCFFYEEKSILEPSLTNNCLNRTEVGKDCVTGETYFYTHDAHGNISSMPHLSLMEWDYRDQLHASATQKVDPGKTPETTYYVYGASGNRVRKVTEGFADVGDNRRKMKNRLYLGSFELYEEYNGDGQPIAIERESLHVMDNAQRVAIVDTRAPMGDDGSPLQTIRYQLGNHLGSASLEIDQAGEIISYEEYYSFGSTSYQAGRIYQK